MCPDKAQLHDSHYSELWQRKNEKTKISMETFHHTNYRYIDVEEVTAEAGEFFILNVQLHMG